MKWAAAHHTFAADSQAKEPVYAGYNAQNVRCSQPLPCIRSAATLSSSVAACLLRSPSRQMHAV
ncbi:hypothetical protein TIFTF001_025167 [Ficus carica]|uniref:Uncharacterized protein n=1 Tax=Ficus carica TaxID=3494 RepID=A0AA88B167_FICCA|nr:hypothetical protein TIFTF001_025167 [Ficus carica]